MKCPKCSTEFFGEQCPNCGYKVSEYDKAINTLMMLAGVGRKRAEELYRAGFKDIADIRKSSEDELAKVRGIGKELAKKIKKDAEKKVSIRFCSVCGSLVPQDATVCPKCGAPLEEREEKPEPEEEQKDEEFEEDEGRLHIGKVGICPSCGALVPKGSTMCPVCGADLSDVKLEEPKPMEDPMEVLKRVFGVDSIPQVTEEEEQNVDIRVCTNCGALVVNKEVCPVCGSPVPKVTLKPYEEEVDLSETLSVCPNCGAFVSPDATQCHICGAALVKEEPQEEGVSFADIMNALMSGAQKERTHIEESVNTEPQVQEIPHPEIIAPEEFAGEAPEPAVEESVGSEAEPGISLEDMLSEMEQEIASEITESAEISTAPESTEIGASISAETTISAEPEELLEVEELEELIKEVEPELEAEASKIVQEKPEKVHVKPEKGVERKAPVSPSAVRAEKEYAIKKKTREERAKIPIRKSPLEGLNNLLYGFGTREDIVSFLPFFTLFLFYISGGFVGSDGYSILMSSVRVVMSIILIPLVIEAYLHIRVGKEELLFGAALSLFAVAGFVPYGLYAAALSIPVFAIIKKEFHWIPLIVYSSVFIIYPQNSLISLLLLLGAFVGHLKHRYYELNILAVPEIGVSAVDSEELYERGLQAFRDKKYYEAIFLLNRALKIKPDDVRILNTLGLAYGRIGNTESALGMFKKAVEIDPDYMYAWNNMGNVYARMEQYDKAIECYRKALAIDPNYEDALLNLGYIMIRQGNYSEALKMATKLKSVA